MITLQLSFLFQLWVAAVIAIVVDFDSVIVDRFCCNYSELLCSGFCVTAVEHTAVVVPTIIAGLLL